MTLSYDNTDPAHPLGPLYAEYLSVCRHHRARLLALEFAKSLEPMEQACFCFYILDLQVASYQNHGKSSELSSKRTAARVRKHWREQQKVLADAEKLEPLVKKAMDRMEKEPEARIGINAKVSLGLLRLSLAADCFNGQRGGVDGSRYRSLIRSAETHLTLAAIGLP